ncbi:RNA polymerase sigma-70 factor (ECF subfamily) [Nesterenkonia sandarakina]|uniref:RNA polymerase sigma-70 factor (ECF subfamily) n=2 Tax=Nesterenkonia sandarakina TaxID=272918 RepID=A0A2T0YDN9_9MICC|nr:RNA polymerase sigma-70 factor (ECF subfamily) [Nesterenkonia sandarakina]
MQVLSYRGVERMRDQADASFDISDAFEKNAEPLFAFALNALGDRSVAEDCVEETFVRAGHDRDGYTAQDGAGRTWLFSIMRNIVTDQLRARAGRVAPAQRETAEWESRSAIEDRLMEERLDLYEALSGLISEHREVIAAVQIEGITYQQLSERTGVGVGTLRTRMYNGLRCLQQALERKGPS